MHHQTRSAPIWSVEFCAGLGIAAKQQAAGVSPSVVSK
jgi:hypothetical protein